MLAISAIKIGLDNLIYSSSEFLCLLYMLQGYQI